MSQNKIYIGNLPYRATEDELSGFFAACGDVLEVRIVTDRDSGRSKGFGFVSFSSREAVDAALGLDGKEFQGRMLKISMAKESTGGSSYRERERNY